MSDVVASVYNSPVTRRSAIMRLVRKLSLQFSCKLCVLALPAVLAGFAAGAPAQMTESSPNGIDTPIHVRVTRPVRPQVIPPTLFGSFLEPIGHSTYGGLWADVVENPSFEEGLWSAGNVENMLRARPELRRASSLGLPLPWQPLDPSQGNRYMPVRGDAANSAQSILIMSLPGKEVGILEQVYLPVRRELAYHGSLWVKHVRGQGTVSISLRRHARPEQTLASTTVNATSATWTRLPFELEIKPNQLAPLEPADLVISLSDDARAMIDNVSLNPADAIDGMDPDVIAMARDLHSPLVRFGGNFTSAYDWTDGIGPIDKRFSKVNLSWGIPEYNTFGTDEFLRFCELIHAQPQIALNLGTGTPHQSSDWVNYVDKHWGDHKGGLLWEMGNELWGDFQVGYPSQQRIAAVTLATSQAVRKVDPNSRLIATGGDEDSFHDWNAQQLTNAVGSFNYLSTHFVVNDNVQLAHASSEFRTMAALALPWGLAERMHAIKQQAAGAGHKDVNVAFTEWLMISESRTGPHFSNMGGALFAGGFLNMVMRNSDVVSVSDMTGILEFGGIWKKRGQVYGAPAYWVLRTYASAEPSMLLSVDSDAPTYSISKGVMRLPEIAHVPYLDIVAAESRDRSKLLLLCVNRHLTRDLTAKIDLSTLGTGGSVKITTIAGENILTENDEEDPQRVVPVTHTRQLAGDLDYTFPNASITVVEIPLKN
jgi:alpha-L-arabinofuranosidase